MHICDLLCICAYICKSVHICKHLCIYAIIPACLHIFPHLCIYVSICPSQRDRSLPNGPPNI